MASYQSPGVYREDLFVTPAAPLPTGVAGFVGWSTGDGGAVELQRAAELPERFTQVDVYLAAAVAGFFANGGQRCYVVGARAEGDAVQALADPGGGQRAYVTGARTDAQRVKALCDAIERLAPIVDLDLVAIPEAMSLQEEGAQQQVQAALVAHCARAGDRFAILDAPGGKDPQNTDIDRVFVAWRHGMGLAQPENAALYYPWVKVAQTGDPAGRAIPPCGHVAGIYARSDARIGVFKAPANEELRAVLDVEFAIGQATQNGLNPAGINCLRAFPGRGLRVWGARTLSQDPRWRYVNVRRLFITLGRWIDRHLAWAAFEPNTPRLWVRIQRELNIYLGRLWQSGALQGATPAAAFYVKCDAETNPTQGREQGQVVTEIGLAPAAPAEFIIVQITHRPSGARFGD